MGNTFTMNLLYKLKLYEQVTKQKEGHKVVGHSICKLIKANIQNVQYKLST